MNILQDPSKKTSITSLLNPQDVSSFSSLGSVQTHHGHPQTPSSYFQQEYQPHSTFNLRAAEWEHHPDIRRKPGSLDQSQVTQYPVQLHDSQHQPVHSLPVQSPYQFVPTPRLITPQMGESQQYRSNGQMWPSQQNSSSAIQYGPPSVAPMYSEERTALSADYNHDAHYSSNNVQPPGNNPDIQTWQTTERASVRLAARGTSAQPMSNGHDGRFSPPNYYHPPRMSASPLMQQTEQHQQQLGNNVTPSQSLDSYSSSGSSSSKRQRQDDEPNPNPKTKRTKAKLKATGTEPAVSNTSGSSKRGYSTKKRIEAAMINAQNEKYRELKKQQMESDKDPYNESSEVNSELFYVPELQFARCMSNRYRNEEFPRCVSCTRRWAGDTCRFQGIRFFMRDAQKKLVGVSFNESHASTQSPVMDFPKKWNQSLELEHTKRTKLSIAKALLPVLQSEQEHIKASEIVRRPRECDVRVTCDTCMTSLFSTSFMCRLCGREVCYECFQQVVELTREPQNATPAELAAYASRREKHAHASPFFLNCTKRIEHGVTEFTPVTRFLSDELDQAVSDMQQILRESDVTDGISSGCNEAMFDERNTALQDDLPPEECSRVSSQGQTQEISETATTSPVTADLINLPNPFPDPLLHPIYDSYTPRGVSEVSASIPIYRLQLIPASLYDPQPCQAISSNRSPPFASLWRKGVPLLVKGVLPRFKLNWSPEYFMERYGDQSCLIVECQTDENKRINIREFFSMFGNYKDRKHCWKLKDWPPTAEFKYAFPELYEDFSQAVPVPDYVRRDGVYNMGSHFPINAIGPDLGPKMYNALASSQEVGSKGSTRLHMDMADALNVMLHATSCEDGTEGYAVWDLFRAEDSDRIRDFLKRRFAFGGSRVSTASANGHTGQKKGANTGAGPSQAGAVGGSSAGDKPAAPQAPAPPIQIIGHDPIHGQQLYLDEQLRKELYEECGVKSYRVYQRPGDGVFIPAGCAHQVANMADCMKIAIDFVSPENIDRCEQLTKEFREQNQSKVWKEDVLQLRTMMWFAWQSCTKREQDLTNAAGKHAPPVPPQSQKQSSRK